MGFPESNTKGERLSHQVCLPFSLSFVFCPAPASCWNTDVILEVEQPYCDREAISRRAKATLRMTEQKELSPCITMETLNQTLESVYFGDWSRLRYTSSLVDVKALGSSACYSRRLLPEAMVECGGQCQKSRGLHSRLQLVSPSQGQGQNYSHPFMVRMNAHPTAPPVLRRNRHTPALPVQQGVQQGSPGCPSGDREGPST